MNTEPKIIRFILGDQLNLHHSWFKTIDANILYVMMEIRQETDYVMHHVQKVLAFFAAMREFGRQLRQNGHHVHYIKLDDPENKQSIPANLLKLIHHSSFRI